MAIVHILKTFRKRSYKVHREDNFVVWKYLQRRRDASGGAGGKCPPIFVFAPPIYFLPPTVFFWEEEVVFLAGKNVEICDFRQKKPSDFGGDLFFWRSPAFGRKKKR